MSRNSARNDSEHSFDIDELLRIGTMCMELRKEKDMLKESHFKSAELIRGLESDVASLSEARLEDGKYIQELEGELRNCSEEIETLQDQLNMRNIEANWLGEHVHSLELKLTEASKLQENVNQLNEELLNSNSERFFLMRELEKKEVELRNSRICIKKLEEAVSSTALDSECEIESMKLDLINMEQMSDEAKEFQERTTQEIAKMNGLIQEFAAQIQDSQKVIELLEEENRDLRNKVETSGSTSGSFDPRIEEFLMERLDKKDRSQLDSWFSSKPRRKLQLSEETGISEEGLGTRLSELEVVVASDEHVKGEMKRMSQKIHEYELLLEQLKDELREEKAKAKEEAEDLTQEMAELRYKITGMLEEECKRRARIEQASLQRIAELEAQIERGHRKSSCRCGELVCDSSGECSEAKYIVDEFVNDDRGLEQLSVA